MTTPGETTPLIHEGQSKAHDESPKATLLAARFSRFLQRVFPQYGRFASLEEAWYNFEYYVLPRRVKNADGSYSKASVGQPNSSLYPAWTTPVHQLKDFGTGIAVYFETLLALTVICFVAGLLYMPTILYYGSDGYTSQEIHTLSGPLRGSLICPEPVWVPCVNCHAEEFRDNAIRLGYDTEQLVFAQKNTCAPLYWKQGANHLVVMVFVILSIFWLGQYQKKLELSYDESVLSASDYSIQVDNPPADATDPDEWKAFFEQFGKVAFVTVALDNSDLLNALSRRRTLLQKANFQNTKSTTEFMEQEQLAQSLSGGSLEAKLESISDQCHELLQKEYPTSAVFVTFEKERAQRLALATLHVGQLNIINNNLGALPPEHRFRENLLLSVFEAPEPSEIRWQDLDETWTRKTIERIISTLLSVAVVAGGFFLVHSAFETDLSLAATEIALLNILMPHVFKRINAIESHQSESTYQASLYWKIAVFRWINTGIITIIIKPNTLTLSDTPDGLVKAVHAVLKAEIIIAPVLHMLDIMGNIKRLIIAPQAKNQTAMNTYFRGSNQSLGEKYTNTTKTIFLVFFYCAIFPSSFFFGAAALLLTYLTDKYLLLRSWGPMPTLGDDVARLGRKVFFPLTAVVLAVMSEFFYSAYPCDNLCDTDTVVEEQSQYIGQHVIQPLAGETTGTAVVEVGDTLYRYCDQDFLERLDTLTNFFFAEKDDWMKGDQQSMSFVFGLFAVATAVIMLVINLRSDLDQMKADALGGYATSERDSGETYQSVPDILAYIPQIVNKSFSFPLIGADLGTFTGKYVGWHDPLLEYKFYDLSHDVKVLSGKDANHGCCLSQVKHVKSQIPVHLEWKPFLLNPNLTESQDLKEHLGKKYGAAATANFGDPNGRLMQMGKAVGIQFNMQRRMVNTIPAHALVEAVKLQKGNETANRLMEILYKDYFEHAKDISDNTVLLEAAESVGMDAREAVMAIETGKADVRRKDREVKNALGVTGVPFYVIEQNNGDRPISFSGAYPVDVIAEQLEQAAS